MAKRMNFNKIIVYVLFIAILNVSVIKGKLSFLATLFLRTQFLSNFKFCETPPIDNIFDYFFRFLFVCGLEDKIIVKMFIVVSCNSRDQEVVEFYFWVVATW